MPLELRLGLVERWRAAVGPPTRRGQERAHDTYEYGDDHRERTTVAVINGRSIWPVECKYGRVFAVEGLNVAFATFDRAIAHARTLPEAGPCSDAPARQGARHVAVRRGELR